MSCVHHVVWRFLLKSTTGTCRSFFQGQHHHCYRVKESNDNFQVANVYQISELSETGDIIRTCTLSNASPSLNQPIYLSVTSDYRVFVVDMMNNSILLLDEKLTSARVLVTRDKEHQLVAPQRLHYSLDDHLLIVGCFSGFLVFDLYQTRT